MMNHFVPDFDAEDDYSIPTSSSSLNLPKKSAMADDEIMELMWQNGQVVAQSQRSHKKPSPPSKHAGEQSTAAVEPRGPSDYPHLFMQEDEMASWLQYPLHDDDFCADLLYQNPHAPAAVSQAQESVSYAAAQTSGSRAPPPPPPPSVSCSPLEEPATNRTAVTPILPAPPGRAVRNFGHFSRLKGINPRAQSTPAAVSKTVVREPSPTARSETMRRTEAVSGGTEVTGRTTGISSVAVGGASSSTFRDARSKDLGREVSVSSSSGEAGIKPPPAMPLDDRKRKGRETDEIECQSEDAKQGHGSSSTKRSRAAEVHNLSERRRRDRINEKMRALQELIPRCNKSDKASMLDEAIEYLKSLQLQVQMMSMGCGMVPMMYPAVQQYVPPHVMMGLGMDMGMNRPIMPYPNVLAGSTIPPPVHLGGPRFPVPQFPMQAVHPSDPNRIQMVNQPAEPMTNSFGMQNPNQTNIPSFPDPYQQFLGLQLQIPQPTVQNQSTEHPSSSKPNTGKELDNPENHHQSG